MNAAVESVTNVLLNVLLFNNFDQLCKHMDVHVHLIIVQCLDFILRHHTYLLHLTSIVNHI